MVKHSQLHSMALRAKRGARPSGKPWTDPADKAWAAVNGRPSRVASQRSAFRLVAKLYP